MTANLPAKNQPCENCPQKDSPIGNCAKEYNEFNGRRIIKRHAISCLKLEEQLPSMEHGEKYDYNYIQESANNHRKPELARILDTALARANLTHKEQALLEAIYAPNIIPCEGVRDLPGCDDCLTCRKKERRKNRGCEYHTFIYLNFFTHGAKPRLEYKPWHRYFSVMSKEIGSSVETDRLQGRIDTNPVERGRRKPGVFQDSDCRESFVSGSLGDSQQLTHEIFVSLSNEFREPIINKKVKTGPEKDYIDLQGGRGEFSIYRDISFEKHLERLNSGKREKLWY